MIRVLCFLLAVIGAASAEAQVRAGAFVSRRGGVDLTRERYRFDGVSLNTEVDVVVRGVRLEARTDYSPGLSPTHYRATVRSAAGRRAMQELRATFSDSVHWTVQVGETSRVASRPISRPFAIAQDLLFSHLAVILLRYNRRAGGVQVLDVWLPEPARVGQVRMSLQGDSGTVELGSALYHVRVDGQGWLQSVSAPSRGLTVEARATIDVPVTAYADTAPPASVRESTLAIRTSRAGSLEGTLSWPATGNARVPVAIIVPGAGAMDRDGNAPPALQASTYALLAWRLAERGVAVYRYQQPRPGAATLEDRAAAVASAVEGLSRISRLGPVILVGHGEGAWVALRAAARGSPLAGVALLSVWGRSYATGMTDQIGREIDSATARRFGEVFSRFLQGEDLAELPPVFRPLLSPPRRAALRSLAAFDPVAAIGAVKGPVLIVQGAADTHAAIGDAEALRAARPDASLAVIPRANHFFKPVSTRDPIAELALYRDPTIPLVPELVETLDSWIDGLIRP